jgi:hypothetical protein
LDQWFEGLRKLKAVVGLLGAIFAALTATLTVTFWPASDQWLRTRGLEKLERYIQDFRLTPMSDVRLCDLVPADNEPLLSKHFICRVDLVEGTLHWDVAFTLNGGIEYSDGEVTRP